MTKKVLPIGTYQYNNKQATARKLVNCTADQATPDSGNLIVLRRMPGIPSFATAGAAARGAHFFKGEMYTVSSQSLFKVSEAGVVTTIGTIPGTGRVNIDDNGTTMVIVTNPDMYETDGVTVSQNTDPVFVGFGGASDVAFLDGFFIFSVPNSKVTFASGLNALTFNALDFASVEGSPGNILGLIADHREIIYLKERTTEIWYNAALPVGFPLARNANGYLEIGGAAADTLAKIGGSVYWLADDNTVRQLSGSSPAIISNIGISKFISGEDTSQAYGFAYTFEDKHYYVLTLPGATIEYDILAQEWHNRETFNRDNWDVLTILDGYRSSFAFNIRTGEIGKLDNKVRTEWGGIQKVTWTYQEIEADGRRVLHDRFELSMGTGVGLTGGDNPQLGLWISDDGGVTFYEFDTKGLGKIGNYLDRVTFFKLGSSYNRVYRCEVSDAVDVIAFDTNIEIRASGF